VVEPRGLESLTPCLQSDGKARAVLLRRAELWGTPLDSAE